MHPPPSTPAKSRTTFFSLPRELRDTIYALCFAHGNYSFASHGLQIILRMHLPGVDPPRACLEPWLLTNKQLLQEAMQQFYRDVQSAHATRAYRLRKRSKGEKVLQLERLDPRTFSWDIWVGCRTAITGRGSVNEENYRDAVRILEGGVGDMICEVEAGVCVEERDVEMCVRGPLRVRR